MQFLSPAKVNLSLRILGKRADGFHEIETLMAPLTLADTLTIERTSETGLRFTCNDDRLPLDGNNLVVKAVDAFRQKTGVSDGVSIHLQKSIPHGAGLAGGSSDAATTLMALDEMFSTGLDSRQLSELAAALGSDIPFFFFRSAAICRGKGEIVEALEDLPKIPLILIKPGFEVSTPWAYKNWANSREVPGFNYSAQKLDWGELVNDLERPVFEKFLFLGILKRWLVEQPEAVGTLMSGSGSTVFAVLTDEKAGRELLARARREFGDEFWAWCGMTL
jgi:4-diphosphocytidyl-2-C-methyl-D-erythritol kinase